MRRTTTYWLTHALAPAAATAVLSILLLVRHGDLVVADALYAVQGHAWWFKKTFLAEEVIHVAGRNASLAAWSAVFVAWMASFRATRLAPWRRPLGYLLLAVAAGVTAVSLLKSVSPLDCPWNLARYGGSRDYFGLFDLRPDSLPRGGCFPAGHASAGYGWVALYFFLGLVAPAWRSHGLAGALLAGLVFGVSQQLRGAHFLSHDVCSLAICWFAALGIFHAMFGQRRTALSPARIAAHG